MFSSPVDYVMELNLSTFQMDKLELPADLPINSALAVRLVTASVFHPFELAKVLMQVGHEPIAPRQSKTLFGTPKLALPSVFQVGRVVLCLYPCLCLCLVC